MTIPVEVVKIISNTGAMEVLRRGVIEESRAKHLVTACDGVIRVSEVLHMYANDFVFAGVVWEA